MLEIGIFWIGAVMVFAAYLILLVDLFRHNKIWAIVGMLLIIPLLIHAILNWSTLNVRKAFYALIIGVLAILVSIAGGALAHLPFLQDHEVVQVLEDNIAPPKVEPLPNEEQASTATLSQQADYDPVLTGSEYEDIEVKEIASEAKKNVVGVASSSRYQSISQEELQHAINKQIRITMQDEEIVIGKLTNIEEDAVLVESSVDGGILGLSYPHTLIKKMEVLLLNGEPLFIEESIQEEDIVVEQDEIIEQVPTELPIEEQKIVEEVVTPSVEEIEDAQIMNQSESQLPVDDALEAIEEITQETPVSDGIVTE